MNSRCGHLTPKVPTVSEAKPPRVQGGDLVHINGHLDHPVDRPLAHQVGHHRSGGLEIRIIVLPHEARALRVQHHDALVEHVRTFVRAPPPGFIS
jgi:hypothetical protein